MRSLGLAWGVLLFVLGAAGCAVTYTAPYPKDWPAILEVAQGQCPRIEGRYVNAEVSESQGCFADDPKHREDCIAVFLSSHILSGHPSDLDRGRASRWIELKQPDDNTLVIEFEKGGAPVVLRQSDGEFTCGSEGLTLLSSRSIVIHKDNASCSFRPLEDGSLLMKMITHARGVHLLGFSPIPPFIIPIPYSIRGTDYVRWPAFVPGQESKAASP